VTALSVRHDSKARSSDLAFAYAGGGKFTSSVASFRNSWKAGSCESPWVRWRVGGLESGDLAGLLKAMVPALKFGRWDVTDGAVQAPRIPPLDLSRGGELHLPERPPGALAVDDLGLVEAVYIFGQGVVVRISTGTN